MLPAVEDEITTGVIREAVTTVVRVGIVDVGRGVLHFSAPPVLVRHVALHIIEIFVQVEIIIPHVLPLLIGGTYLTQTATYAPTK
jgi:hypothetical protein